MGIHGDVPVMLFDAPIHARQARDRSPCRLLGGKKNGSKNTVFCHLLMPVPVSSTMILIYGPLTTLKMFIRQCSLRPNPRFSEVILNRPPSGMASPRVDRDVQECVFQLVQVSRNKRGFLWTLTAISMRRSMVRFHEAHYLLDKGIHVDFLKAQRALFSRTLVIAS